MTAPKRFGFAVLLLCVPLAMLPAQPVAPRPDKPVFRYPESTHGAAGLKYHGKIPVLETAGTPEEMGAQIGMLHAKVLKDMQDLVEGYVRARGWRDIYPWIVKSGSLLEWNFPLSHRREFAAGPPAPAAASGGCRDARRCAADHKGCRRRSR